MNNLLEALNLTGSKFIDFALPMLIQSSVLIVILLGANFILRKRVRAVFRYWLWALVLIKLVLPVSLTSPVSIGTLFGENLEVVTQNVTPALPQETAIPIVFDSEPVAETLKPVINETPITQAALPEVQSVTQSLSWQGLVFLVWLAIVFAMVLLLVQRVFFVASLIRQSKPANSIMNETLQFCRKRMKVNLPVKLKVSLNATSPAVCGLIRPVILVPNEIGPNLGAGALRQVLMHELAHIKRGDLWMNLAQTLLQISYFYNPLLWLANACIRRIREQAVDEAVQAAMGEKASEYPETLLNVAKLAFKKPALSLRFIGVVESKSQLNWRIKKMLTQPIPKSAKLGIAGLAIIIITAIVLLPMAKATEDKKIKATENTESTEVLEAKQFSAKVNELNIDTATLDDVIRIFSEPLKYHQLNVPGHVFSKNNLPVEYELSYPKGFSVTIKNGQVEKLGFHEPGYVFLGKLQVGSSVEKVLEAVGPPIKVIKGKKSMPFMDKVLLKDYMGRKGECRYCSSDLNVMFFFEDYKISRFYLTNSDYLFKNLPITPEESNPKAKQFKATLLNGVTVELVGVCDWINGQVRSWQPDGTALNQDIHLKKERFQKWEDNFGFFAKFSGPEGMDTKWLKISGAVHSSSTYPVFDNHGNELQDYEGASGKIVDGRSSTSIRFGAVTEQWSTIAEFDGDRKISGKNDIVFSRPIESKNGTVVAVRGEWGFDGVRRIIAMDTQGKEHRGGWSGRSSGDHALATTEFRNLSPEQIQRYKVQFRPYKWVTFKNVSLKPNFKTDVQIDTENPAEQVEEGKDKKEEDVESNKQSILRKLLTFEEQRLRVERDLAVAERSLDEVRDRFGITDLEERSYPHPITARFTRLQKERDDCVLEISQVKANIENLERQKRDYDAPSEELQKAEADFIVLREKLKELEKMVEEAKAEKQNLDLARSQYQQRVSVRDERREALNNIKSQIEKLRIRYEEAKSPASKENHAAQVEN